ncbi:MAG: sulfite exporter TauE/SafE family protein, partial [Desulfobacterales bacterium]
MVYIRVRSVGWFFGSLMIFLLSCPALAAATEQSTAGATGYPWWFWPIILFFFCLILGVLAVMAGVGGGVLYVPLVSGFFPFHIDFVRGVGLMVALAGALAAGPGLLRRNLANLRLALPVALVASTCSIFGAMLGLYLSSLNPNIIQACLGITIVGIAMLLLFSKNTEKPVV